MPPSNQKRQKAAAAEPAPAPVAPFLGRELRVELTDGRIIVGLLLAYEGSGDLLLQSVLEERTYKDAKPSDGVTVRGVNLLAIPFKHVKALHRRREGNEPLSSVLEEEINKTTHQAETAAAAA